MKTAQKILQENGFDELCGGILKNLHYDMLNHQITFDVDVLDVTVEAYYQVVCFGVVEFLVRHDELEAQWDYIDLTAIEIEQDDGFYIVGTELWTSEMIIKCQEVNLTVKEIKKL